MEQRTDPKLNRCPWTAEDTRIFLWLRTGAYSPQRWRDKPYRALYYRTLNI